jgi:DNA-binding PadR family transcriptional regulator
VRYHHSGLRRDLCALVAREDGATTGELKRALEERYESRLRPKTVRGALSELVESGDLTVEADGLHDRYALTEDGERRLREHAAWLAECV